MSDDVKKRIFEPFFTTKDINRGTGLGLAVVYGIVRGHNGTIGVESKPGHGTRFTISFPLQQNGKAAAGVAAGIDTPETRGEGSIFIIEDEREVCATMQSIAERAGYRVWTAMDGNAGLDFYRRRHADIDVVILNLGLPGIGGTELFAQMKQIRPDVVGILCSGFFDPRFKEQATVLGIRAFIEKPFSDKEFLAPIHNVLSDHRRNRSSLESFTSPKS